MSIIISILAALFAIFIVVLIHELGHFSVARYFKVRVLTFSIGFGKAVWSWRSSKSGIEYRIGVFPLGGYVKMHGEQNELAGSEKIEDPEAYCNKPVFQRMAIAAAGPIANFLLAIVAFAIVFMVGVTYVKPRIGYIVPKSIAAQSGFEKGDEITHIAGDRIYGWQQALTSMVAHIGDESPVPVQVLRAGQPMTHRMDLSSWRVEKRQPDLFGTLGMIPYRPKLQPVLASVSANEPAAIAGLQVGDRIVKVGNTPTPYWSDVVRALHHQRKQTVLIGVERKGQPLNYFVRVAEKEVQGKQVPHIGVGVKIPDVSGLPKEMLYKDQESLLPALLLGVERTWHYLVFNIVVLGKMFTGSISMNQLGGPISIFKTAGQVSQAGIALYFKFIAIISIALGFLNLLPIPVLDGGHILFQCVEAIRGRPLSERYQLLGIKIGIVLLGWLMIQATFNDILRLI